MRILAEVPDLPGVRSVRYQMHYRGEPFGDVVTGYVFVLPEELQGWVMVAKFAHATSQPPRSDCSRFSQPQ